MKQKHSMCVYVDYRSFLLLLKDLFNVIIAKSSGLIRIVMVVAFFSTSIVSDSDSSRQKGKMIGFRITHYYDGGLL